MSKASDDFPEPDGPVITVTARRGMRTVRFLRLCCRAPRTMIASFTSGKLIAGRGHTLTAVEPRLPAAAAVERAFVGKEWPSNLRSRVKHQ